jgi:hypothetical protein
MNQKQTFLAEIEAFLVLSRMSASTFGHKVANDGKFVAEVRQGRSVRLDMADRVRRFIAEYERERHSGAGERRRQCAA